MIECDERELWVMGLGDRVDRGAVVCSYLAEGGYRARTASMPDLAACTPLAILLDLSPQPSSLTSLPGPMTAGGSCSL